MKITPDRLAVARAVQAEYLRSWVEPSHRSAAATLALDILIESLPEPPDDSPATLPAPTGPGLWWTKRVGSPWFPCEVYRDGEYLIVYLIGSDVDESVGDFDAWLPLVAPTAKGGV